MRKFLVFNDSKCAELSPLTFDEFDKLNRWTGTNDLAFDQFLQHNNFFELDQFNKDVIKTSKLEIIDGEPIIDWSVEYLHDTKCSSCKNFEYHSWNKIKGIND